MMNFLVKKKPVNRQSKYEYYPKNNMELRDTIIDLLRHGITDLNCIDVTKVTNLSWVFSYVNNIIPVKDIDISEWDVSNVINMNCMFYKCKEFNSDLSKWDVSKVTNMYSMFNDCEEFNCDLSNWNVSNVTNMLGMFFNCTEFVSDISKWDVSKVKYMTSMFFNCKKFNSDLSKWDVYNVANMISMFDDCDTLIKNNKIPIWYKRRV